ncbi:hypothetical protein I8Y06_003287 [Photobacterium damselae]|nr:hypothetical protein [Photobacterium damselae]
MFEFNLVTNFVSYLLTFLLCLLGFVVGVIKYDTMVLINAYLGKDYFMFSEKLELDLALSTAGLAGYISNKMRTMETLVDEAKRKISDGENFLFSSCGRNYKDLNFGYKLTENKRILVVRERQVKIVRDSITLTYAKIESAIAIVNNEQSAPFVNMCCAETREITDKFSQLEWDKDFSLIHRFLDHLSTKKTYLNTFDCIIVLSATPIDIQTQLAVPVIVASNTISVEFLKRNVFHNAPNSWSSYDYDHALSTLLCKLSDTGSIYPAIINNLGITKHGKKFCIANIDSISYELIPVIGDTINDALEYFDNFSMSAELIQNHLSDFYTSSVKSIYAIESTWVDSL